MVVKATIAVVVAFVVVCLVSVVAFATMTSKSPAKHPTVTTHHA